MCGDGERPVAPGQACPLPIEDADRVLLAHGGGGRLMHRLLESVFYPALANPWLDARHDGAVLEAGAARVALTTDSYVVRPLFFPGGDIGRLAVCGTVNDLAMCGARPLALSAGFILEEGLPFETVRRVVRSMREAADACRVSIVTGDTKVVDRGKADGLFVTTAGVGVVPEGVRIEPSRIRSGDAVVLSGDVGRHGIAVLAVREGLAFESALESDCAPLADAVAALLEAGVDVHALRDLTRGGLASAVVELAESARVTIRLVEDDIDVIEPVRGACEILGLDPLYVANEGRFVAFVPFGQADRAVQALRSAPVSAGARVIGRVEEGEDALVMLRSRVGASRVVDLLSGEQLPRIC